MQQINRLSILPFGMINSYVIRGAKKHVLVDAGLPDSEKQILQQLQLLGLSLKDIGLLVITHGHIDHFGSANALSKALDVPILVHENDAPALSTGKSLVATLKPTQAYWNLLKWKLSADTATPVVPDLILRADEVFSLKEFGIAGSVIHTPGHTPGSLSIVLDNGEAIIMDLASSGIFLGGILCRSRMKHPPFHHDKSLVKHSIHQLLAKNTETFYLGHGYPVNRKLLLHYAETMLG
ncbi:MBL fold metallo-hydrolase [Pedobacter sp. SYSU D00535]|uniref:MBL fold metallo-hydrolase n=1 Tax=Pedobacter sp. SYSU D00535 TaxID=2810308 RepID=UPI001A978EB2|nr:MBL fold metallo-hydrolase [Pedobacter sp. SYSU D00535]